MAQPENMIGIDIGSAAINVVEIDPACKMVNFAYGFDQGHGQRGTDIDILTAEISKSINQYPSPRYPLIAILGLPEL